MTITWPAIVGFAVGMAVMLIVCWLWFLLAVIDKSPAVTMQHQRIKCYGRGGKNG